MYFIFTREGSRAQTLYTVWEQTGRRYGKKWIQLADKYESSRYVDTKRARKDLTDKENIEAYSAFDLTRHMYTLLLLQYEARIKSNKI